MKTNSKEKELIDIFFYVNEDLNDKRRSYLQFNEIQSIYEKYVEAEKKYLSFKEKFENTDNELSLEIFSLLKITFNYWIDILDKTKFNIGVSRNIRMGKDFLLITIKDYIKKIVCHVDEISVPIFIDALDKKDSFDKEKLIVFFKNEIIELDRMELINYFTIIEFYNTFLFKIEDLKNENQ